MNKEDYRRENSKNENLDNNISRRSFFKKASVLAAALAVGYGAKKLLSSLEENKEKEHGLVTFSTGSLAGMRLDGLYKYYLGMNSEIVPKEISVDFSKQLNKLWDIKDRKYNTSQAVDTARRELLKDYDKKRTFLSLKEYIQKADRVANNIYENLDWEKYGNKAKLDEIKVNLLKKLSSKIGGEELLAYAFTELLPSDNGKINVKVFDLLLENAGREYIESIPAIYDKYASIGPFQMTSYALYDIPGEEKRGASKVAPYVKDLDFPSNVIKLRGDDNFEAAYLFAVDNISFILRKLDKSQVNKFKDLYDYSGDDLVQYIATAHHAPANARVAFKRFIDKGCKKGEFYKSCNKALTLYALKTKNNYKAINEKE